MLDAEIHKKICEFVKSKPRTVQEIAEHIKKNWRTAERYVEKIALETGCIATRIFREGTRGALKIVFWNSIEDIHSTSFQQELVDGIMSAKTKHEFSCFDIYQYIEDRHKKAYVIDVSKFNPEKEIGKKQDLVGFLKKATKQVLFFSGNMSWVNSRQGNTKIIDVVRELAKKGVLIKVITRVSMIGSENAKKLLAINKELGKDIIEIKHRYQPLRGLIIDDKVVLLREVKDPAYYDAGELKKKIEIFYEIHDREWIEWMQKIFWKMFSTAMASEKRIKEIGKIHNEIF